jgi:ABC-type branched-subunit amino acid transport system substrate-binding protein
VHDTWGKSSMSDSSRKHKVKTFIILFWSVAFIATGALLVAYRLGLTGFEPIITFLVLIGLVAVLSILFSHIGGGRPTDYKVVALGKLFGRAGLITIAAWLLVGGVFGFLLFREPEQTIKIGINLPLSGDEGAKGAPILAGMYQALVQERESFKKATGYSLEFVIKDDAQADGSFDAQKGKNNIESLIAKDNVSAILGPYNTDVAIKAIPIVNKHGIALLSTTTTSNCLTTPLPLAIDAAKQCSLDLQAEYSRPNRSFFRLTAPNSEIANVVVTCLGKGVSPSLCAGTAKYSKLVVLRDDTTYGAEQAVQLVQKWQDSVMSGQKTVLSYIDRPITDGELPQDIRDRIAKIASADEPVLVFFAGTRRLETLYDNIRRLPYAALASNESLANSTFTDYIASSPTDNPLYAVSGYQSIDRGSISRAANSKQVQTGVEAFMAAYKEGYRPDGSLARELIKVARKNGVTLDEKKFNAGESVSPASATGYDATRILIGAIKKAMGQVDEVDRKTNSAKFREAIITNIRGSWQGSQYAYKGVTGTYSGFEEDGDIKDYTPVSVYEYEPDAATKWQSR